VTEQPLLKKVVIFILKVNMVTLPQHFKGWIDFLQDTRTHMVCKFILPVRATLQDSSLTQEQKITKMNEIERSYQMSISKFDPKQYGVNLP